MFRLFLIISIFLFHTFQEKVYSEDEVDVKPKLMYGANALTRYIARNFKSPKTEAPPQKIICEFIVELDGSISNVKVINEVNENFKNEALKIFKGFKEPWYPALKNNKQVRCKTKYEIAIGMP